MKKVYQILAIAGLSFMTIGASAQTPAKGTAKFTPKAVSATNRFAYKANNTKKATALNPDLLADNFAGDQALNAAGTFFYWSPALALNSMYSIKDTGTAYNLLSNTATVLFDTIYDLYTSGFATPITAGSLTVDTITAQIEYHNTSGNNDTILFLITSVAPGTGLPQAVPTVYGIDTVVITPTSFSATSNRLDSTHFIFCKKNTVIPSTAYKGYGFAITMTVKTAASDYLKDTIAPVYYSQGSSNCAALGGDYNNAPTSIGVSDGVQRNVNSLVYGLYYNNSGGQHGTNVAELNPLISGAQQGFCENGNGYYNSPLPLALVGFPSCAGDTNWYAFQDIAIYPSISTVPLAVNNVTMNGLNVAQNAPNPFNKNSQINYNLTKSSDVVFSIFDLTGRKLVENNYSHVAPGQHVINLAANEFTPGIYFYSFNVNGNVVTKRMVITQ